MTADDDLSAQLPADALSRAAVGHPQVHPRTAPRRAAFRPLQRPKGNGKMLAHEHPNDEAT